MVTRTIRPSGAVATIGKTGAAEVTSATGARIELSSALSTPGFSPVDLLYASIAGCLVVSARIAASEMKILDRLAKVHVEVHGRKAAHAPSRIERLETRFEITGDFDEATRTALIARAEELCTVSNTIRNTPEFADGH